MPGCSAGIPGSSPRAAQRAEGIPESSAPWCRGFFYRITVIMGQEAIMRLTDARGYVVGTSQVSMLQLRRCFRAGPASTLVCWHPGQRCGSCGSKILLKVICLWNVL